MTARVLRLDLNDLDQYATPVVVEFWRLRRPSEPRDWGTGGDYRFAPLQPYLDDSLGGDFAQLSDWEKRPILISPTIDLARLAQRFPWARPRTVARVLRLLVLHECAHFALGHNGLRTAMDHNGDRESLRLKAEVMERAADELARRWWREGLTRANVPVSAGIAFRVVDGGVCRMDRAEATRKGLRPGDVVDHEAPTLARRVRSSIVAAYDRRRAAAS